MDTSVEFRQLMQYGAVGAVAAGLLTLVVVLFRQFVNHALEQNKSLLESHDEFLKENLKALHDVATAMKGVETMVREVGRDLGQLFNEVSAITEGSRGYERSRGHRVKPPRGSGSG